MRAGLRPMRQQLALALLLLRLLVVRCNSAVLTVHVASDSLSYFKVTAPTEGSLRVFAESDRPLALMAGYGYFPSEEHYDVSNFLGWAKGAASAELVVPIEQLKASPCDPPGVIEKCFAEMKHMRCGLASDLTALYATNSKMRECHKYVGSSNDGTCPRERGPATFNSTESGASGGSPLAGDCFCQRGFCEISGRCVQADAVQDSCYKVTGRTCPFYTCEQAYGPTNCEDGLCICQPGYCAINGVCKSGPSCEEQDSKAMCDAASGYFSAQGRRLATPPTTGDCCQVMDDARRDRPGRFVRCAARHFFALESAAQKGLRVPLLADLHSGTEDSADIVIAVRSSAGNLEGDAEVRLSVASGRGSDTPLVRALDFFSTLQELVAPRLMDREVEMQMVEAPFVADGDSPQTLPLKLQKGQPIVLKLPENAFHQARRGTLLLRLVGLPDSSTVLYSRTWPDPRSLMDFGHAVLAEQVENLQDGQLVYRAAALNTQYFAVVPSADAQAWAFFTLHPFPNSVDSELQPLAGRLALPQGTQQNVEGGLGAMAHFLAGSLVLGALVALCASLWKMRFRIQAMLADHRYIEIESGAERVVMQDDIDEPDDEGGLYTTGPFLQALQTLQDNLKAKASQRDMGFASWSSRMLSASTRAGSTTRSGNIDDTLSPDGSEEEELLGPDRSSSSRADPNLIDAGDESDQEAMQALLKLRPAAQDSVGDDFDDDEMSSAPLMGTGRQTALRRGGSSHR